MSLLLVYWTKEADTPQSFWEGPNCDGKLISDTSPLRHQVVCTNDPKNINLSVKPQRIVFSISTQTPIRLHFSFPPNPKKQKRSVFTDYLENPKTQTCIDLHRHTYRHPYPARCDFLNPMKL